MQAMRRLLIDNPMEIIAPLAILAAVFVAGWAVRRLILRVMRAWTARTQSRPAMILTDALRGPLLIWSLMLAAHLSVQFSDLPARYAAWVAEALLALWILSLTLMFMRVAGDLVRLYGAEVPSALPVTTLTQNLAQLGVFILGLLLLLKTLHFDVTPMLTALGVGGLAVALALQDTLSNLFAGFYVAIAGQVRPGDYIKLNTGEEGYITDIGWRTTSMRALAHNLIIVPNSKLAQAIVTNFSLPDKHLASQVQVGVSQNSDPEQVERVLLEIGTRSAREIPGMLADPAPSVMFEPGFGDFNLGFSLNYHVAEFANQGAVRHELRKRILLRFREEGIQIPFPTRTIHVEGPGTPAA